MADTMTQVDLKADGRVPGRSPTPLRANELEFWVGRSTKGKLVRFWILICLAVLLAVVPH